MPIKIEARLRRQGSATACVALAVDGGKLEIPFGPGCRRGEGELSEYRGAAHSLCEVSSTIRLSGLGADDSWIRGALLAALVPDAAEGSSTVFASLYDSAQCSGEAVASVAKVVRFGQAVDPVNPEPGAADAAPPPDAAPPDSGEDGGPLPDGAPAPDAADGSP